MKTITLKIDERTKFGKLFLNLVEFFITEKKGISIVEDEKQELGGGLDTALEDAKNGRVTSYATSDDLFDKVLR